MKFFSASETRTALPFDKLIEALRRMGNLQGRHIREIGRRGAVMVTVDEGHTSVERFFLDVLRWEVVDVDVTHCLTMSDVARRVGADLNELLSGRLRGIA